MQVKTYSGPNAQQVLAQVKLDLGSDAIILSSKDVEKDGNKWHEVTAGVDRPEKSSNFVLNEWQKEWGKVKEHLYSLMQPSMQWEKLSPRQKVALEYLQREGVDDGIIMDLYQKMLTNTGISVLEALSEIMPTRPFGRELWVNRLHILTGPFGTGKTTTALRLALLLRAENSLIKLAFINADCERGNGRLMLRHWAELSSFSYYEASEQNSMARALAACADADFIFIDLPGLTKEQTLEAQLTSLGLAHLPNIAIHLVLPPHYSNSQNKAVLQQYSSGLLSSLIWSKLDESISYAPMVNVAVSSGLPISALSYGSSMRHSLASSHETLLWRLIFKHQLPTNQTPSSDSMDRANTNE